MKKRRGILHRIETPSCGGRMSRLAVGLILGVVPAMVPWTALAAEPAATNDTSATTGILEPGAAPKLLLEQGVEEGPAWHPEWGLLFTGDKERIGQLDPQGQQKIFREDAGTNGLLFDRQGRLLACESSRRRITRREADGTWTVLADRFGGEPFNQPNDLTLDSQNRLYFSDPVYGNRSGIRQKDPDGRDVEGVYRIDPDGKVARIITHEVDRPNGLLVSPDDKYLYVADNNNSYLGAPRKLYRFELQADGSIEPNSRKLMFDWETGRGPDGLKIDRAGRLFVAGGLNKPHPRVETADKFKGGVYVLSPEGKLLEFIPIPHDEVTNCAFGGADLKTLYITAGGTLWSVRVQTPGVVAWPNSTGDKP